MVQPIELQILIPNDESQIPQLLFIQLNLFRNQRILQIMKPKIQKFHLLIDALVRYLYHQLKQNHPMVVYVVCRISEIL